MYVKQRNPDERLSTVYLGDISPDGVEPKRGCTAELVVCPSCGVYFCALWAADVMYAECPACSARFRPEAEAVDRIQPEHAKRLALRVLAYLVQQGGTLNVPLDKLCAVQGGALRVIPDIADNKVIISSSE